MRFLLDTNVPKGLTGWIAARGHESEHALDVQLAQELDPVVWRRALETGAVIVSKDEDFAVMVRASREGPSVVWLRTGNGTTRDLIAFLAPVWSGIEARLQAGDRLIEIR